MRIDLLRNEAIPATITKLSRDKRAQPQAETSWRNLLC